MPQFDLSKYATVAERMAKLKVDYPEYRIITENLTTPEDRQTGTWVMKATLFLTEGDQAAGLPKATGHAFEVDGMGMANKTSALENAESSAIGRCLMVAGYAMSKDNLASREEMEKVSRGDNLGDWLVQAGKLKSVEQLRKLYIKAKANGATDDELKEIRRLADERGSTSKPQRSGGGVSSSPETGAV
jgi:hypothetical protein